MPLPDAILAVLGKIRFAFTSKTWPKVLVLIIGTHDSRTPYRHRRTPSHRSR